MRGSLLGDEFLTHTEHLSIRSLICLICLAIKLIFWHVNSTFGYPDDPHGIFVKFPAALKEE